MPTPHMKFGRRYGPKLRPATLLVLGAVLIALDPLSLPLIKYSEAGGKGKVPVYMPIPIPIPMPVGPPPPPLPPAHSGGHGGGKFFQPQGHGFNRFSHDESDGDGEGEVKKIYLLQPMPRQQPQPQLKGGGFMGPVQNNIHLNQGDGQFSHSPGKHRHAGGGGRGFNVNQQQQQQQVSGEGDTEQRPHDAQHKSLKAAASSEVKILPIVVIPPMAPMAPIQVPSPQTQSTSASHRMMFSPQFNNFLVAGASQSNERMRRDKHHHLHHHQQQQQRHHAHNRDSFGASDYGGSVGGSIYREHFAARLRPGGFGARSQRADFNNAADSMQSHRMTRSRDFDYGDLDYDNRPSAEELAHLAQRRRHFRNNHILQRRHHQTTTAQYGRHHNQQQQQQHPEANRIKSIRDILEAHKAARFEDYDQAVNQDQQPDYNNVGEGDASSAEARAQRLPAIDLDASDYSMAGQRGRSTGGAFEISLDDLSSQLAASDSNQHGLRTLAPSGQDLGALRYSSVDSPPGGGAQKLSAGSSSIDSLEDQADQWRFDSIKSVKHVAAAVNETVTSNSTTEATTGIASTKAPKANT